MSLVKSKRQLEKFVLECSQYFSRMHLVVFYNVVKFHGPNCNIFRDMNYCPVWFLVKSNHQLEKLFLECSQYFSRMHLHVVVFYNVVKFQRPNCNTFWDMNYYPVWILVKSGQTDGQTDRKWCIWAHRAKCTGVLKKVIAYWKVGKIWRLTTNWKSLNNVWKQYGLTGVTREVDSSCS